MRVEALNNLVIHVSDRVLHLGLRYHILATRMATVYGTVSAFDPTTDKWSEYVERLQFYFTANGIKDDSKKHAVLLSNCDRRRFGCYGV